MELRRLLTVEEMLPCLHLIQQLSPSITFESYKTSLVAMIPHRYAMLAAFEGHGCVGLSGYWIGHKFYSGRYLEIDNFVVDASHRSRGIGKRLVEELISIAREEGCFQLMLDAYLENASGHRFYERHGFKKRGYHFMRALP